MSPTLIESPDRSPVVSAGDSAPPSQLTAFRVIWVLFALLSGGLAMGSVDAAPELWGDSLFGQHWIETGRLAKTTTGSFTAIGFPWINLNHLSDLLIGWTELRFGSPGLLIGKFVLSQILLGMILLQSRRMQVSWGMSGVCVILASVGLSSHWQVRPQILGYTLFGGMLVSLSWIFQGWEGRWNLQYWQALKLFIHQGVDYHWKRMRCLWLSIGLFALWTNTDSSSAIGLSVFVGYLALRSLEALTLWGWEGEGRVRRLILMSCVSAVGTCATPYGLRLHQWMLEAGGQAQPELVDWQPVAFATVEALPFCGLFILALWALTRSRRLKDFTHLVILGLMAWQGFRHVWLSPFFVLLVAFWIPAHAQSAWSRLKKRSENTPHNLNLPRSPWWACAGLSLGLAFVGMELVSRASRLEVDTSRYPVAAMQFLEDRQLRGRTVVSPSWAQYALACFAQESDPLRRSTVAYDARHTSSYSPEVVDIYFDFHLGRGYPGKRDRSRKSAPLDPNKALRYENPELFVLDRQQMASVKTLESHSAEWTVLYQDSIAQIWGLKKRFDTPGDVDYLPPGDRQISESPQLGIVAYPALPVMGKTTR